MLLNAKQVNAKEPRKNFYAAAHLLERVLDGYLLTAAHELFQLDDDNIQRKIDQSTGIYELHHNSFSNDVVSCYRL